MYCLLGLIVSELNFSAIFLYSECLTIFILKGPYNFYTQGPLLIFYSGVRTIFIFLLFLYSGSLLISILEQGPHFLYILGPSLFSYSGALWYLCFGALVILILRGPYCFCIRGLIYTTSLPISWQFPRIENIS